MDTDKFLDEIELKLQKYPKGIKWFGGCPVEDNIIAVYALIYEGKIVYIGKSKNVKRRLIEHSLAMWDKGIKKYTSVMYFEVNIDWLSELEAQLINHYKPIYNKVYPKIGRTK